MIYEIGIHYIGDTVYDQQVKLNNIPIDKNQRRFWFGSNIIPHWNEDDINTWIKIPILYNGLNKIYVDDSANRDLSNIDTTMIFGDDFNGTSLDTTKWTLGGDTADLTYSLKNGILELTSTTTGLDQSAIIANYKPIENSVIETKSEATSVGQIMWITFTDTATDVQAANNNQFLYFDNADAENGIRHQSRSGGTWGTEDEFYSTFNKNTYYIGKCNLFATYQDWYILNDNRDVLGSLLNNQDSPQNFAGSYYLGVQVISGTINIDYVFVRKYLPADPIITYIKPYQRMFHIKNTIFNQSNNILSYNSQYIETPVIELDNKIQKVDISTINNKTFYYRGSNTQPDITQTGTTSSNTKYWDQNTISNSGWNNTVPSEYIEYKGITNYKYIQYKIPTSY